MIVEIDHVQVAAPPGCEEEARRFYGGILGLEEITKPPVLRARGGVWFRAGRGELHVGVAADFAPATKAHPAFRASSAATLEQLSRRLEQHGVDVRWAAEDEIPGTRRFFTAAPWGNRIELVT